MAPTVYVAGMLIEDGTVPLYPVTVAFPPETENVRPPCAIAAKATSHHKGNIRHAIPDGRSNRDATTKLLEHRVEKGCASQSELGAESEYWITFGIVTRRFAAHQRIPHLAMIVRFWAVFWAGPTGSDRQAKSPG